MTEKDLFCSFNEIEYSDKELEEYNKPVEDKDKILSYQWIMRRRIAFSVLLPEIEKQLSDGEKILYYMAAEDEYAKIYQALSATITGIGMLPMISFGIQSVIVVTDTRLIHAILKADLKIDRIISYQYADIESIGTVYLYKGKEYKRLFIKFKDRDRVTCFFVGKKADYTKLLDTIKHNCENIKVESCDGDYQAEINKSNFIWTIISVFALIYLILCILPYF